MPNLVYSKVTFTGERESLERMIDSVTIDRYHLDFNKVYPLDDVPADKLYDARLDNWGTPRNAIDTSLDDYGNEVILYYTSAWNDAGSIITAISKRFGLSAVHVSKDSGSGEICHSIIENGKYISITYEEFNQEEDSE